MSGVKRTSIHTPLKPASVQDLKAKFSSSGGDEAAGTKPPERGGTRGSFGKGSTAVASSVASSSSSKSSISSVSTVSSGVTLSSLSSSLQSAAQRKVGSNLSGPRPYSPPKQDVRTSLDRDKDFRSSLERDKDLRSSLERDKDGRLELPVMHITTSGSEVKVETRVGSRYLGQKVSETRNVFDSKGAKLPPTTTATTSKFSAGLNSSSSKASTSTTTGSISSKVGKVTAPGLTKAVTNSRQASPPCQRAKAAPGSPKASPSPPVQRSKRLVAREITIERLDSGEQVTSYKDTKTPAEVSSKPSGSADVGNKVREVKVERLPDTKPTPEFRQVKLRTTKGDGERSPRGQKLNVDKSDLDDKRKSRKISPERFERLKFDFERGVPTETVTRQNSESDHIALQQKARELGSPNDDTPIIHKKKKEESILTEGLKVSDFVKQVNKMNPELEGPPKWKLARQKSQPGGVNSEEAASNTADSYYQGIPGEDFPLGQDEDDDDAIYEKVVPTALSSTDGEQDGENKSPNRRLGVYRKKGGKRKEVKHSQSTEAFSDGEEVVIHSDGEGGWANSSGSSSGTEYEEFGQEEEGGDLYEDLENFSQPSKATKGNTLTHKLKNIFVNKKVKKKKSKPTTDSGVSAGTDSEGDIVEDGEDSDITENLSRTSSERSRGKLETAAAPTTTTTAATTASPGIGHYNNTAPPGGEEGTTGTAPTSMASGNPPPPALPPRTTKALAQGAENSPPLPPRNPSLCNKASLGVPSLDTVVPISPSAGHGKSYDKKKDRFSFGNSSLDGTDPSSGAKLEYIDYDPASPNTLERIAQSDRKSASLGRPASMSATTTTSSGRHGNGSSYMYPDMSTFQEMKALANEDNLYVDLEDEHIYGKTSDIYVSQFESEPLYQWYSKDKMIQNTRTSSEKSTSDDLSDEEYLELEESKHADEQSIYEDVERLLENSSSSSSLSGPATREVTSGQSARDKPQRRSIIEDVFKNGGTLHRALWCQMPEVVASGILKTISDKEKKIQEAMFEIMTSEASYLKSLKILINVFLVAPEFSADMSDRCVITRRDRQVLFSNIGHIKDISEGFLKDLESRWQESYYLKDICDIIERHASKHFEPYVRYCSNQLFQDRALNSLKQKPEFSEAVKRLEQHPDCQFLPLASFLLLPMQRITRLPLLVDAICHRLEPDTPRHTSAQRALDSLRKVAKRCDEAAKKMQQTEQICLLAGSLEFKVKEIALVSSSRFLVKQGELTMVKGDGTTRKPLSKLLGSGKEHVHLFLFNDILLLTKKKGSNYQVRDYCQRNSLHVEAIDNPDKSRHLTPGMAAGVHNILFLALLANHENKQVELVLSCKGESERTRWIDAIIPTQSASDSERIYDVWDCPQYQCVRKYLAQQPDELNLEESDVVNVTRKMADGWCEGERIRDGEKGWFPSSHTEEINNSHVRARNLRLRYRLMIASSQEYSQVDYSKA